MQKISNSRDQKLYLFNNQVLYPAPVEGITKAKEYRSWLFDPTYTLNKSVINTLNGKVVMREGDKLNPLENAEWGMELIFIDGEDEEQVQWAVRKINETDAISRVYLTSGSPILLEIVLGLQSIGFDNQGALCKRYGIKCVPAIVKQEWYMLRVEEIKL